MSYPVSTLLLRNLHDVFGEIDPVRRRATIDEIFHEDAVFYDPNGIYRARDEIDRIAGVIKATHPDFRYQPLSPPEVIGDAGRVRWVSGSPGKPPAYAGTDFIISRPTTLSPSICFLTSLPKLDLRPREFSARRASSPAAVSPAAPQFACRTPILASRGNTSSRTYGNSST